MTGPFLHGRNTVTEGSGSQTAALVGDVQLHIAGFVFEAQNCRPASGVAVDVLKPLLDDPKQRDFDRMGKSRQVLRKIQFERNAGCFGVAVGQGAERGGQPKLVEQGRVEQIRQVADLPDAAIGEGDALLDGLSNRRVNRAGCENHGQTDAQRAEVLAGGVVQLAGDPSLLLILHLDQATEMRETH